MENHENNKVLYELAFLLPVGKDETSLKAALGKYGFEIVREGGVKEIKLAYKIGKQEVAGFGYYIVSLALGEENSEVVKKISHELNLDEGVLRYMFMKYQEPKMRERKTEEGDKLRRTKKEEMIPAVDRIDHLSNEKLEETLEEILK